MRFGPVPLSQAAGAVLAHSVALPGGGRLRKGGVLLPDDLVALAAAGIERVTVARLDPGDVAEDAAAAQLAAALVPDPGAAGLRVGQAVTGRVNLHADTAGLLEIDVAQVQALNAVDPIVTLATLPPLRRVAPGMMVGTVKIIAYAVEGGALDAACAAGACALRVRRPVLTRARLIQTAIRAGDTGEKGHAVTAERLARLGVTLDPPQVVPHEASALAQALGQGDAPLTLILTGSATSDWHDTAPEALRLAGGRVVHFGMPVDPGNLLFIGDLGGRPVVGLPGCARSPALNGADWVLERLICGLPATPADIAAMGVGGLLKEIPQRGRPREA